MDPTTTLENTFAEDFPGSVPSETTSSAGASTLTTALSAEELIMHQRLSALGVDFSKYPSIYQREAQREIVSRKNRGIVTALSKAFASRLIQRVPDPLMMTHILTTRCNYMCSFCSFADTLNTKTEDMTLPEIEQVYATMGNSLNTIVYSGGETTLYTDLPQVIEAAYRLTPVKSVYIISNAWKPERLFQITHHVLQRCPDLHLTWSLSIEGPKEYNNLERRTRAASWDAWQNTIDTLEGLKAMREHFGYSQLDVQLCTVCSPGNHGLMMDWYETVRDVLQPDKWNLNLLRKSVQMTEHDMASFDERRKQNKLEPFERTYLQVTERVRQDVLSGRLQFMYHTDNPMDGAMKSAVDLISQDENRRTVTEQSNKVACLAGYTGAYIGSTGAVSGCEEFANNPTDNKTYGLLREQEYDFQAVWRSQTANTLRQKTGNASECRGCTLESQRNYPSILVSLKNLGRAALLGQKIQKAAKSLAAHSE